MPKGRNPSVMVAALVFALGIPVIGYVYFGVLVASLFFVGYLGGFFLWLLFPQQAPRASIQLPYWVTLLAFLFLHLPEENVTLFHHVMSENITGVPVPQTTPTLVLLMLILPVGAWLCGPYLIKRGYDFGYYLAWSLFASMGILELAHFIFPLLTGEPYRYFPGMASVVLLALLAWWGMWRLARRSVMER